MSAIGLPESPKPPTASEAPSGMSATASAAVPTCLSITRHSFVARCGVRRASSASFAPGGLSRLAMNHVHDPVTVCRMHP
jgi:hypothetical protein